jgi:ribonucleoside-diphosphate reductase alpha chain
VDLTEQAIKLLKDYYMREYEKTPDEAFKRTAYAFCGGNEHLAERIYSYIKKNWFMFSSPILSNAPEKDEKVRGLPISCFLGYVPDTLEGLIDHTSELRWLSVKGGGVGGHWSDVRSVSDIAPGPIPFLHTVDADMTAYKQGVTRKGSYAAYMDISHPDIMEFMSLRVPTGDVNRKCLNLHHGVNVPDSFMEAVESDSKWDLIDPKTKKATETVVARELWENLLETRYRTGEPYIYFIDAANRAYPQTQKDKGLFTRGSNLCIEITLPTNEERTAVCCLSSLNLEMYDAWKGTKLVADLTTFLDNVLDYFIDHAPDQIHKARFSASQERSIGIGAMGWHNLLMKKSISFESQAAAELNEEVFSYIKKEAEQQSLALGATRGECPDMIGTGRRNACLIAIAPNANSSSISGTSPSVEPIKANAFVHRTRAGSHLIKNRYVKKVLKSYGQNTDDVWNSIIGNNGSIQHLEFLSDHEKSVFKTAIEINQNAIVRLGGQRSKYICQSQSLNVFFPAGVDKKYLHDVHYNAWKEGNKSLYYLRTETSNKAETLSKRIEQKTMKDYAETPSGRDLLAGVEAEFASQVDCPSCEG